MSRLIRVGYMGIPFSNSEEMALTFSNKLDLRKYELVPLMSAKNVIDSLQKKEIEYGVLASENKFTGIVQETEEALMDADHVKEIDTLWSPIHHCVFKKDANDDVTVLISHIQAIQQSENNLKKLYPDARYEECEDTAYAAEMLAKGMLPKGYAAVCRRDAGEHYGLYLDNENVEDSKENMTKFSLIILE